MRVVFVYLFINFYLLCIGVLSACKSLYYTNIVPTGPEKVLDPLELEVWMVLSCHMSARN